MTSGNGARGIPTAIVEAMHEYRRRKTLLEGLGVPESEHDETIRKECLALAGSVAATERVNLAAWVGLTDIARPVLEALVLMLHAQARRATPPPLVVDPVESSQQGVETPAPVGHRPESLGRNQKP